MRMDGDAVPGGGGDDGIVEALCSEMFGDEDEDESPQWIHMKPQKTVFDKGIFFQNVTNKCSLELQGVRQQLNVEAMKIF